MSDTDKTDPYWVQKMHYGIEVHDHRKGECYFDPPEGRHLHWRNRNAPCEIKLYPKRGYGWQLRCFKRTTAVGFEARQDEGGARNATRINLLNVRKYGTHEDADVAPTRHRHNAMWGW